MNFLDKLTLAGRRFEQRRTPQTGSSQFHLPEVLSMFNGKAILELTTQAAGESPRSSRPDPQRKLKVSLLDALSDIHPEAGGWYEVYTTAPTGDLSKVRIVGLNPNGGESGELNMVVGRRTLDHYFLEDPLLTSINQEGGRV